MRISLHSIMLKVLLVVVLWCVNVSSTSNDFKPIPFIHITKTGGTAVDHSEYGEFLQVNGHSPTMRSIIKNNSIFALAIIREPTDRFLSMFRYWNYGSELYDHDNCKDFLPQDRRMCSLNSEMNSGDSVSVEQTIERGDEDNCIALQEFIRKWSLRNVTSTFCHPDEGYDSSASEGVRNCSAWTPSVWPWYMWEDHFLPQIHWLLSSSGNKRKNVVLVRFTPDENIFASRIHNAVASLGAPVPSSVIKVGLRNVSKKPEQRTCGEKSDVDSLKGGATYNLTESNKLWLRRDVFWDDYALWNVAKCTSVRQYRALESSVLIIYQLGEFKHESNRVKIMANDIKKTQTLIMKRVDGCTYH